ncbi:uncharacterized protein LOC109706401 [Ananas comosus]|uniref:Uncharacterized protein LOC109706401 n=1 Tax=Ananas comosus TaxID=4615 RepID=A0A6P5EN68_ANACO|nr:uncharacterized protein LOC109706401 [Ananas comosus]
MTFDSDAPSTVAHHSGHLSEKCVDCIWRSCFADTFCAEPRQVWLRHSLSGRAAYVRGAHIQTTPAPTSAPPGELVGLALQALLLRRITLPPDTPAVKTEALEQILPRSLLPPRRARSTWLSYQEQAHASPRKPYNDVTFVMYEATRRALRPHFFPTSRFCHALYLSGCCAVFQPPRPSARGSCHLSFDSGHDRPAAPPDSPRAGVLRRAREKRKAGKRPAAEEVRSQTTTSRPAYPGTRRSEPVARTWPSTQPRRAASSPAPAALIRSPRSSSLRRVHASPSLRPRTPLLVLASEGPLSSPATARRSPLAQRHFHRGIPLHQQSPGSPPPGAQCPPSTHQPSHGTAMPVLPNSGRPPRVTTGRPRGPPCTQGQMNTRAAAARGLWSRYHFTLYPGNSQLESVVIRLLRAPCIAIPFNR